MSNTNVNSFSADTQLRITLVAFDDYTDIDLILMWDLLNRVHMPHWSVRIVGDADYHKSMTGLSVPIHGLITEVNTADAVLFTSGKGTRVKSKDPAYLSMFHLDPERQLIGSICSGALMLAALGLLKGKRATTYPSAKLLLEQYEVRVVEKPFVLEGNVATAGGCLAAQYLVGWVIERLLGAAIRDAVITSCQPVGEGLSFDTDVEPEMVTKI
jgi:transcriptional regulator GlxA family with amidase domain